MHARSAVPRRRQVTRDERRHLERGIGLFFLILMLVQPQLPILDAVARSIPVAPAQPLQPAANPLPPGSSSLTEPWNATLYPKCTPAPTTQKLEPVEGSANITAAIPAEIIGTQASGQLITQTYTIYSNGSFSARDDAGNEFGIGGIVGLSSGTVTTSLRANSTEAVQNYLAVAGPRIMANVTVLYAIKNTLCLPSGLKITIVGTTSSSHARIALHFMRHPTSSEKSGIWFVDSPNAPQQSNSSGDTPSQTRLGFDWSDSASLNPSYLLNNDTLVYRVGSSFVIDPTVVGTSGYWAATGSSAERKLFYYKGNYLAFYSNGTSIVCRSSTDGSSWSAATLVTSAKGSTATTNLGMWISGNEVFYALTSSGQLYSFQYAVGRLHGGCSIDWTTVQTVDVPAITDAYGTSVAVSLDRTVYVAVAVHDYRYNYYEYLYKNTTDSSLRKVATFTDLYSILLPLSSGKIANIAQRDSWQLRIYISSDGGINWPEAYATQFSYELGYSSAVSVGDKVYIAAAWPPTGVLSALSFDADNPSAGITETAIEAGLLGVSAGISTDGSSFAIVYGGGSDVYYTVSVNGFSSWTRPALIAGAESYVTYVSSEYCMNNGTFASFWTSEVIPYAVRFVALPTLIDPAVASPDSWSRPGLSPYESYFAGLSEYVSPGNGLLGVSQQDLALPGRGLDLAIGRVFSSPYAFDGNSPFQYDNYSLTNLGYGWSLNFPWFGTQYLHLTDGQAYAYQWSGNTFEFHGAVDFHLELIGYGGNAAYYLFMKSGITYAFGFQNRSLLSVTDPSGKNVIKFRYGSNGYLSQIVDTVGRVVTFSYDAATPSHLIRISSGGRSWAYSYSGNNLVSVKDPLGRVTQFVYGGPNGWLLKRVTYPTGGRTDYAYTTQPVLTELTLHQVSLQNIYRTSSNSSLTKSTSFLYQLDGSGNVLQSNFTVSDGHSVQGHTSYDFFNQKAMSKEYDYDSKSNLLKVAESDFDSHGRINETKLISPAGVVLATTENSYDSWGNLIQSTDPYGASVYFSYANTDSQNHFSGGSFSNAFYSNLISSNIHDRLVGEARYQSFNMVPMETYCKYNLTGYLVETKQLHNGSWTYTGYAHDRYGNLISTTDPLGHTTHLSYSSQYGSAYLTQQSIMVSGKNVSQRFAYAFSTGFQTSATDARGNTTSYRYDALGRVTKTTNPAVNGLVTSKTYSYDDKHNTASVADEDGNLVQESFDGLGRMSGVTYYNGSTPYSSAQYSYNWQNQVSKTTTPAGNSYLYSYDYLGRPIGVVNPDSTFRTTYYDLVNDVVTTVDENGHQTQTLLDRDNRVVGVNEYYSGTLYYSTKYSYDSAGNLLTVQDGKGNFTVYQYDDLNRLILTQSPDLTFQRVTYDSAGNVATTTDAEDVQVTSAYDELNRLGSVTFPNSTQLLYFYDGNGNLAKMFYPAQPAQGATDSTTYSYDARNRMTGETQTVDGKAYSLTYSYDGVGNAVSMKYPDGYSITATYDALNRLHKLGALATFSYTLDNQVASVKYGDGETSTYAYNSRDEPTRILVQLGSVKQLDLNYSYDKVGNVKKIGTETYGYDYLNRLTSSNGPWGSITYTYDPVGNRLTMVQGSSKTSYTYNNVNELTKAGKTTYSYDANGNLVQEVAGGTTWKYGYDYENQLISVTKMTGSSSSVMQRSVYDGMGQRVKKVEGSTTTVYMYQGTNIVYSKAGATVTKLFYAGGMAIARITGSSTYFYHGDVVGSVRLESTSTGGAYFTSNYMPYGPQYGQTGSDTFRYTGKPYDASTNLYYSGARFYDPTTGRFITRDPASVSLGDPQSLNQYAYARDNPMTITDPTGRDAVGDAWNWITSHGTTLLLAGAVVGLTIVSALQLGLDPITDALDAGAIADLAGSLGLTAASLGASAAGLPVVLTTVTEINFDLTPVEISMLEQASEGRTRTILVQSFLENRLPGGTQGVETLETSNGGRRFDLKYVNEETGQWIYVELKNSGDPVKTKELIKDLELQANGVNIEYMFTRTKWGSWSEGDISQVEGLFPYRLFNFRATYSWWD